MIYIFWSAANSDEAESITKMLLERRLIACGSILPNVTSLYHWEGEIAKETETKVILKTTEERFSQVEKTIRSMCSYNVPEVAAITVDHVSSDYLAWLNTTMSS